MAAILWSLHVKVSAYARILNWKWNRIDSFPPSIREVPCGTPVYTVKVSVFQGAFFGSNPMSHSKNARFLLNCKELEQRTRALMLNTIRRLRELAGIDPSIEARSSCTFYPWHSGRSGVCYGVCYATYTKDAESIESAVDSSLR